MFSKKVRNLVLINCLLLTLPSFAFAEENGQDSSEYILDEVIVNAVPLEKYLVTTSVITDEDIAEKGAKNLSEALQGVTGVNMHRGKKNSNSLDIRGMNMSYTKIYIDGVLVNPLAKTAGSDVDLDMIPVENIAKIEVIKGPAPVSYGTDAVGGIILITTKNGKAFQGGKVSLSGGSDSTRNFTVSYGGGDDKFNYFFNAGTEHTDGFRDNAERKSNYFNTKLNWKVKENATLTFAGSYSNTDKGCLNPIDPATGGLLFYKNGYWCGMDDWKIRDWKQTNLSLTYAEKASDKFDYTVKLYRFDEENALWADGHTLYTGTPSIKPKFYTPNQWNASYWDSTLEGVEFQGNLKFDAQNTLTFGTLYNDTDWKKSDSSTGDPYIFPWKKYNDKRTGYYIQDNFQPNEKTTVTFGLRYDKDEVRDYSEPDSKIVSETNPTLNVVYQLDNNNTLRASYGQTISFPTLSQLYGTNGYPDLKPEKATNYELGWKHRFDDSLTGDFAVFQNDISDMIDTFVDSDGDKHYMNMNEAKIKGIEVQLNKKFTKRCDGFVNYTYLDTTGTMALYNSVTENNDILKTNDMKNVPNHKINYGLNYQADKGYKFSLTGHLVSSRATWDETSFGKNGATDTRQGGLHYNRLPAYHVMDLMVKRQINENQDWYINVYNIFDREYDDELFFPAAGRTVIAGLDFKF